MTDDSREVQHEPEVLEGEDDVPRMPASPIDPFTPELHARAASVASAANRSRRIPWRSSGARSASRTCPRSSC